MHTHTRARAHTHTRTRAHSYIFLSLSPSLPLSLSPSPISLSSTRLPDRISTVANPHRFSDNNLDPHGATAVAEALTAVTSLTSLDMGSRVPLPPLT